MLIATYFALINIVLPNFAELIVALMPTIMSSVIVLTGIAILLHAVIGSGSQNISSGIVRGLGNGTRVVLTAIGRAILFLITGFFRIVPRIYRWNLGMIQRNKRIAPTRREVFIASILTGVALIAII